MRNWYSRHLSPDPSDSGGADDPDNNPLPDDKGDTNPPAEPTEPNDGKGEPSGNGSDDKLAQARNEAISERKKRQALEATVQQMKAESEARNKKLAKATRVTAPDVMKAIDRHISNPAKQDVAVGELVRLARSGKAIRPSRLARILGSADYNIEIGGKRYSAGQIERRCHDST